MRAVKERWTTVGGSRGQWVYLDESEARSFRFYQREEIHSGERCYCADYRINGKILYAQRVGTIADGRLASWSRARSRLTLLTEDECTQGGTV